MTMLCTVMAWGNAAKIGNVSYATVAAALEDVPDLSALSAEEFEAAAATQIDLDGDEQEYIHIPAGKKVILNLNAHSVKSPYTPGDNDDVANYASIYNEGYLHIIAQGDAMVSNPIIAGDWGDEWKYPITNKGQLIIDGGTYVCHANNDFRFYMNPPIVFNAGSNYSVVINGGLFILEKNYQNGGGGAFWGIIQGNASAITINGGDFTFNGVDNAAGSAGVRIPDCISDGHVGEWIDFSGTYDEVSVTSVYHVYAASTGTTYSADAEITENVETTDVLVKAGVTVTLKKGYKITCDNLAFEDATAKLVIEAGATVIVEDEIRSSSVDNIHMTMDGRDNGDGNSYLLIKAGQIQESHPLATVVLKSKAYQKANGAYVFQRFTVPTYPGSDTEIARKDIGYTVPTAMYGWDYTNDTWKYMESESVFEPFQCYDMTTQAAAANAQYVFKCRLVGNGNAELPLQGHWNYYANSYTAPIDIAPVIRYLYDDYQGDVSSSVYVHHANGDYWDPINVAQVIRNRMLQTTIEPMQAFVLERINSSANNPSIDYTTHIYNPFMGISNSAPKRNAPVQLDFAYATMKIEAADGSRNTMEMYEGNQFDASFDNGYDVAKHMNENCFNMYFVAQEGNMAYLASDNVANTAITLDTKEATSYTVNFEDVTMEGYALRDNLTGTETELVSGNTYSFSAPANSKIEGRFEIVAIAKMPTAIENTEVKADKKGIYTLTGQYLGENFHALPAGVYVINGKKVVK